MHQEEANSFTALEQKDIRGKLTVFIGAAPGVGKTYTMLETALERLQEGSNIVAGWVDTHGYSEFNLLLTTIPQIPQKIIHVNGTDYHELNVEEIVKLKPQLVLVDDLAYLNSPGSRHVHRYQDVEELLQAGINVYTTLNIQHIESLNDIVAQITGTRVHDTVPDHILEKADNVQLIDVPAEEVIKRFNDGKVRVDRYQGDARKFFRVGNINALRELALRFTAGRVDKAMHDYMRAHKIEGPWPAAERVMVCVSDSPFSAQLIRAARRLANGLQAEFIAVHVEPRSIRFPRVGIDQDRIARNLRLAEELGATTYTVIGDDLAHEILDMARSQNVSSIVVGKPDRKFIRGFLNRSVVEQLIHRSGGINIYVIQAAKEPEDQHTLKAAAQTSLGTWRQYAGGLLMAAGVTAFSYFLGEQMELVNVALLYQLPVVMSAFWWGRWPSYFTALCVVALFDFFFIPPVFTFTVDEIKNFWSFTIFLIAAFIIGGRTEHLKAEAVSARQRERGTRALYEFSREIAAVIDLDLIAKGLAKRAAETIGQSIVILLPNETGSLNVIAEYNIESRDHKLPYDANEHEIAAWTFYHGRTAGRSTETSSTAQYLYIPLKTKENTVGVLGIKLVEPFVSAEDKRMIDAWVGLAAIAIERVRYADQAREAALLTESERLRTALFNSISHELRTPLSSIVGSVSTLLEAGGVYSEKARYQLLETIHDGAARMERLISNLLDTARLESGMMKLKVDWCDIIDIIGSSLHRMESTVSRYAVDVDVEPELPLVRADCVLLEQVMINLIDNAMKYSVSGSRISIKASYEDGCIIAAVADRGVGIPEEDINKIFDKFYRVQQPKHVSGTGLGLSICKGIIEAHGGRIWANNNIDGGATIRFSIPASEHLEILPGKAELQHG